MHDVSPLTEENLRATLATKILGRHLHLHAELGSTNQEALRLAQEGCDDGTVVIADAQTAGRGRLGRAWHSPAGVNLYCSVVLKRTPAADRIAEWLSWIPLVSAIAVSEAIVSVTGLRPLLKWPNDVLIGERKVGGILCESGGPSSAPFVIVGIGLNINGSREDLPSFLVPIATTVETEIGRAVDRCRAATELLVQLEHCLDEMSVRGTERLAREYRTRCATLGKTVLARLAGGQELIGIADTIGPAASLKVRSERDGSYRDLRAADIIHLRS